MEGLIPFLFRAMTKQRPQNAYRCLSENSTSGRGYHRLLGCDATEGSSHRRTRSDFQPTSTVDLAQIGSDVSPSNADGLRHRSFSVASHYQVSGRTNNYGY